MTSHGGPEEVVGAAVSVFAGQDILAAFLLALLVSGYGYSRRSLDASGFAAAVCVGTVTFWAHTSFGMLLIAFFFTSSRATRVSAGKKKRLDKEYREGGLRNWVQVLANSGGGAAAAVAFRLSSPAGTPPFPLGSGGAPANFFAAAVLGHYACCNGDTWASELGILDPREPWLVTTLRRVPPGTNGGVSLYGTLASIAAGLVIGATAYLCDPSESKGFAPLVVGTAAGFAGSVIDSLLGATLQFSGFDTEARVVVNSPGRGVRPITGRNFLDNHQVNLVSSLATAGLCGSVTAWYYA